MRVTGKINRKIMGYVNPINKAACLELLCESNYKKLIRLIPELLKINVTAVGISPERPDLTLSIIERSHYTLTIKLTHRFSYATDYPITPDVTIRMYKDAQLAEVLNDCDRSEVYRVYKDPAQINEILHYKWRLNYFLEKWLDHCLTTDYTFNDENQASSALS